MKELKSIGFQEAQGRLRELYFADWKPHKAQMGGVPGGRRACSSGKLGDGFLSFPIHYIYQN
jgi:hypothetical protein